MNWRLRGGFRNVYDEERGVWLSTYYPHTREQAYIEKISRYHPYPRTGGCGRPGHEPHSIIYTRTNIPACCAIRDSIEAYNQAAKRREPLTSSEGSEAGLDYYWSPEPGRHCGHVGKCRLDGSCYICWQEREQAKAAAQLAKVMATPQRDSARKRAIEAGEKWYTPAIGNECKYCGTLARRRVYNGQCEGCLPVKQDARRAWWHDLPADWVMGRDDARALGLSVYRTGDACRRGHRGFRYVSTGGCLECK